MHRLVAKSHEPRCENKEALENHYYIEWSDNSLSSNVFHKPLPHSTFTSNFQNTLLYTHLSDEILHSQQDWLSFPVYTASVWKKGKSHPMISDPVGIFLPWCGTKIWWSVKLFHQLEVSSDSGTHFIHDLGVPELSPLPAPIGKKMHLPRTYLILFWIK